MNDTNKEIENKIEQHINNGLGYLEKIIEGKDNSDKANLIELATRENFNLAVLYIKSGRELSAATQEDLYKRIMVLKFGYEQIQNLLRSGILKVLSAPLYH